MAADIDFDGAMVGTDSALHAAGRIGDNKTRHESLAAGGVALEETVDVH